MFPVTQAIGTPAARARASCGLVAEGVSDASPTACSRAPSCVQSSGRYSSRSSNVLAEGPDVGQEDPLLAQRAAILPRHPR